MNSSNTRQATHDAQIRPDHEPRVGGTHRQRWIDGSAAMRHATECGERDVMRFMRETAGCLVEKDIELRGAVEDLDRRIEEIRLQIVMLSGKKEGRDR